MRPRPTSPAKNTSHEDSARLQLHEREFSPDFSKEKFATFLKKRRLNLKQLSELTGIKHTWLRRLASSGSRPSSDLHLEHLAHFFGLRSWRDWFNEFVPEVDHLAVRKLLEEQTRWPEIVAAADVWQRAQEWFLRRWFEHPWNVRYQAEPHKKKWLKEQWHKRFGTIRRFAIEILECPEKAITGATLHLESVSD
jgi:transcriptional regulator with XRE-family HTH domain